MEFWFIVGVILFFTVCNRPPSKEQERARWYQRRLEHVKWHTAHPRVHSRRCRGCPVCEGKWSRG
jgi:hypothetical protein